MARPQIPIPTDRLAEYCRRHRIRRLSLFASVLRDDFRAESDVDVLVEFEPEVQVGFFGLFQMQEELSALLNRPVDVVLRSGLKPVIRDAVLADALDVCAA